MSRFNLYSLLRVLAVLLVVVAFGGCGGEPSGAPTICVTIPPLAMILGPIAGDALAITTLLPPGASPHTYEIAPSNARAAAGSVGVFFVGDTLDAWAGRIDAPSRTAVIELVPEHQVRFYPSGSHDGVDPHFWLDPVIVRGMLDAFAARLSEMDSAHADDFRRNAEQFAAELDALRAELERILEPARGAAIVQHHPSMDYFFARYGLRTVGAIETSAGQEPTPRDIERLAEAVRAEGARVVVTEPQLPRAPVDALAEMTGATVVQLDPIGGVAGRATYAELLRYNAHALADALK